MNFSQIFTALNKKYKPNEDDIVFARRLSWPSQFIVYHGWTTKDRSPEAIGLKVSFYGGSFDFIPTDDDKNANDWTLDVWNEGDTRMNLSYFEVRKELKNARFCYAYRAGWDDEQPLLSYDLETDSFFLTDFQEKMKWEPTIEDVEKKDWDIKRYLL